MKRKTDAPAKDERPVKAMKSTGERGSVYPYDPVHSSRREIRLLTVLQGRGSRKVNCTISHVSLVANSKPQYEAVSYCWGDASERATVVIDGTTVEVPLSSERVLRRLRLPRTDRTVWIDALCINQNDNQERAEQVGIMGDVYSTATETAIWLGEADDSTPDVLEAIASIQKQQREETGGSSTLKDVIHNDKGDIRFSKTGLPSSCDTDALETFFARPWFQRLWVVQEAVLGPTATCYCGQYTVGWTEISRTAAWLFHKDLHSPISVDNNPGIMRATRIWTFSDREHGYWGSQKNFRSPPLAVLLQDFQECLASDPRDRVFGILGLKPESAMFHILRPDYNKSTRDVFRDATRIAIFERQNLMCLRLVDDVRPEDLGSETYQSYPSWVPRFDRLPATLGYSNPIGFLFRADKGGPTFDYIDHPDDNVLPVKGVVVDTIDRILPVTTAPVKLSIATGLRDWERAESLRKIPDELWDFCNVMKVEYKTGETRVRAFSLALLAGTNYYEYSAAEDPNHENNFAAFIQRAIRLAPSPSLRRLREHMHKTQPASNEVAKHYTHQIMHVGENRNFFGTKAGYVGLGPKLMQEDDIVCVLFGLDLPAILRRIGEQYRFIGLCYVHGIMNGEVIAQMRKGEHREETFDIA